MKSLYENWDFWQKLLTMLENQFGTKSEFILHDLTKEYDHTIVDIRNGHITNRHIGGCGSNLGLEVLKGTVKDGDRYNYVVNHPYGKLLRSSTMYIKNDDNKIIGCLCINTDITETVQFEAFLHQYNQYELQPSQMRTSSEISNMPMEIQNENSHQQELFASDITQVLDFLMDQAQKLIGKPIEEMDRNDKIQYISYLDSKGAFLVTKAAERTYEHLDISKYTFYNYLEIGRQKNHDNLSGKETEEKVAL